MNQYLQHIHSISLWSALFFSPVCVFGDQKIIEAPDEQQETEEKTEFSFVEKEEISGLFFDPLKSFIAYFSGNEKASEAAKSPFSLVAEAIAVLFGLLAIALCAYLIVYIIREKYFSKNRVKTNDE